MLHLVGYLHRCTKMMHGHTNIKRLWPNLRYYLDTFLEELKKIMKMSVTLSGCRLTI